MTKNIIFFSENKYLAKKAFVCEINRTFLLNILAEVPVELNIKNKKQNFNYFEFF